MIALTNRQRKNPISSKMVREAAETILNALGFPDSELSVVIVGDRSIRQLNRDYLGRDKATNVISFSMQEGECAINPLLLGDVVISAATCAREALEAGIAFEARLCFLLLHGILHLTGYDHERSGPEEAARMEAREQELFALLQERNLWEQ